MKNTQKRTRQIVAASLIIAIAAIGTLLFVGSHAATPFLVSEAEAGTVKTPALAVTDSTASGGRAIQFKAAAITPTPPPTPPAGGTVTNGSQISQANTGYLAWRGANGETCSDSQLKVYSGQVNASALGSSASCVWLKGGINIDANITLTACRIDGVAKTYPQEKALVMNYCTVAPNSPGDWSLGDGHFTATRCQITGSSDGVRYSGSTNDTLIENYIRVKPQGSADHNDGIQMYGSSGGGTILRNNIDDRPVGGGGGMNGAIFVADGSSGTYEIRDNYLAGGNSSLRLHESGRYRVTGNIIEKGTYTVSPVNTQNAIPGAFLEWSNNKLSDGTVLNP